LGRRVAGQTAQPQRPTDRSLIVALHDPLRLGRDDPGPYPIGETTTVALAADADKGWEQMAPYFRHEMNSYGAWPAQVDTFEEEVLPAPWRRRTSLGT
jgi:hypothetical protein